VRADERPASFEGIWAEEPESLCEVRISFTFFWQPRWRSHWWRRLVDYEAWVAKDILYKRTVQFGLPAKAILQFIFSLFLTCGHAGSL
jgi:hypothetical protein